MTGFWLPSLAIVVAALLAASIGAAGLGGRPGERLAGVATLLACTAGVAVSLMYLLSGAPALGMTVPLGLPGQSSLLALDGVSAFFLLLVMGLGMAAASASLDPHGTPAATAPAFPVFVAGMALTLLAGDGVTLVVGFETMSLASFILVVTAHREPGVRQAGLLYLGMAGLGAVCLVTALALLAQPGLGFDAIRAHPPQGWRATAVLVLVLVGAGSKAGLAPLHVWLPPAHAAAPGHVSALMSGAMTKVALYVLIRLLFDLAGPAQPGWWAMPLIAMGAGGALIGALRANLETDIKAALASSTVENVGLIAIGLGLAFAARAADLPSLAGLAFGAALLHVMGHGVFKGMLFLAAGSIQHGAGSRALQRLGGLIRTMPFTAAAMLLGAASLAGLPPSAGFAGEWLLIQSVLGASRLGGLGSQILICVLAAVVALATALAAAAAVRLVGVAVLGRPRSPRAAGAEEAGPPARWAMIGLGAVSLLTGLFPAGVLALAEPAARRLSAGGMEQRAGVLLISPQLDGPGYWPLGVVLLLGLALALIAAVLRARGGSGYRTGPAWDCGFGAPPAWLPFGDPATEYAGGSFAQPLRRALGSALLAARDTVGFRAPQDIAPALFTEQRADPADSFLVAPAGAWRARISGLADRMTFLTVRQSLSVLFAVLVLFLALVAWLEQV